MCHLCQTLQVLYLRGFSLAFYDGCIAHFAGASMASVRKLFLSEDQQAGS